MQVLAIDPGPKLSAYVLYDGTIVEYKKLPNDEVLAAIGRFSQWNFLARNTVCACERIRSYGMPAGAELFETAEWCGRYTQAWKERVDTDLKRWRWVERREEKLHLCNSPRANDSTIRQAIIDRFGGKEAAIGKKKAPGPLYGISGDVWAALAVAITAVETQERPGTTKERS